MQMRLIKHTMVTSFDVSLTSPKEGKLGKIVQKNPQLIPNIYQVVGPLQGYIRRPPHGERGMDIENYIKLMIS
jgi:hypothetical protein